MYIFKTHTHPYIQIVNIIFTYSRSHCCECAGADGLFEFSNFTEKLFQPWVKSLQNMLRFPKAEEVLLCVFIDIFWASWVKQKSLDRLAALFFALSWLQTNPVWQSVAPGAFSSILLSILLLCLRVEGETRGSAAAVIERRWQSLIRVRDRTGGPVCCREWGSRFLGGVRKDPEGPGG